MQTKLLTLLLVVLCLSCKKDDADQTPDAQTLTQQIKGTWSLQVPILICPLQENNRLPYH